METIIYNIKSEGIVRRKPVLYFSVYGTTKSVAREIAGLTKADLVEIKPVVPYDSHRDHYNALARSVKNEHDKDMRPKIKNEIYITDYDDIFIGYPIWWYTFPMIVYTLFDKYDFSGKAIIPFNTHLGSRDSGTYEVIRQLEPMAKVLDGLSVEMREAEHGAESVVNEWLKSHGY